MPPGALRSGTFFMRSLPPALKLWGTHLRILCFGVQAGKAAPTRNKVDRGLQTTGKSAAPPALSACVKTSADRKLLPLLKLRRTGRRTGKAALTLLKRRG